jgi:hypothetical protein
MKNQSGSVLISALIIVVIMTIGSMSLLMQADRLEKQAQIPRFLSAFKQMESRVQNTLAGWDWSLSGCNSTDPDAIIRKNEIVDNCLTTGLGSQKTWTHPQIGKFEVDFTNATIDVASNELTFDIKYSPDPPKGIQNSFLQFRDSKKISFIIPTTTTSKYNCPDGHYLSGFSANGDINCTPIDPGLATRFECSAGSYLKSINADGSINCVSLDRTVSCSSGGVITSFSWTGGTPTFSCSPMVDPKVLMPFWKPN